MILKFESGETKQSQAACAQNRAVQKTAEKNDL